MEFLFTLSLISEDLDRLGDATRMSSDSLQSSTQQRTSGYWERFKASDLLLCSCAGEWRIGYHKTVFQMFGPAGWIRRLWFRLVVEPHWESIWVSVCESLEQPGPLMGGAALVVQWLLGRVYGLCDPRGEGEHQGEIENGPCQYACVVR